MASWVKYIGMSLVVLLLIVSTAAASFVGQEGPEEASIAVVATPITPSPSTDVVNIIGIDPTAFPKVKVNVFVDTECGKSGMLTIENFNITENGVPVTIEDFYFTGSAGGKKLDLVIVFDDTGSMGDVIDDMKSKVVGLIDAMESAGLDVRYALVTFKDNATLRLDWTSNATELKNAVESLSASGGGDWAEASLDAIEKALSLGFRPDTQKVLLLITDAPSHVKDDGSGFSSYTKEQVVKDIKSKGVSLIVVSPDFYYSVDPYVDMKEVADEVGGLWIDIYSADFSVILDEIIGVITGSYVLTYTSPDPTPNTTRIVNVTVFDPHCHAWGYDVGEYTSPAMETTVMVESKKVPVGIFEVNVKIMNVTDLAGFQFDIVYNSTLLEFVSAEKGDAIKSWSVFSVDKIAENKVRVVASYFGGSSFTGSGVIAKLKFNATTSGSSILDIENGKLSNSAAEPINASWVDGYVEVLMGIPGDVNMDGSVDVLDLTHLVNIILGTAVPTSCADVNSDGSVDVLDLTHLVNIILGV